MPQASVIIPAHNEERILARTLSCLLDGAKPQELEVVVVCNGCTDATSRVARQFEPRIRVLEIAEPSKNVAVRVGNQSTQTYPRVHMDADVRLTATAVRSLIAPLVAGRVLAAAPTRVIPRDGVSPVVRWYYDVWEELPQVRQGLFGRGVIALSREGQKRVDALPSVMSDDLAISEAFVGAERSVVTAATVVVMPPKTLSDLVRRRVRVATGNAQAQDAGLRAGSSKTSPGALVKMMIDRPSLAPRMPFFLAVTALARIRARKALKRADFTTWHRDESSRR